MDSERFSERAAIQEFDGGMSRFRAETEAAKAQGVTRWRALDEVARGIAERIGRQREALHGNAAGDLPGMQPTPKEEN